MAWRHDAPPSFLSLASLSAVEWPCSGRPEQASVSEQVPAEALPAAVALNGISYNIARSFGPAIGGVIVASAGAVAAFITNALLYLPLLIVLFFWRRLKEPSRLPPGKTGASGHFGSSLHRPLAANSNCSWADLGYRDCRRFSLSTHADRRARPVARRRSNIRRYAGGVWHGCGDRTLGYYFELRGHLGDEVSIRLCMIAMGMCVVLVAISRLPVLSGSALVFAGAGWTASGHAVQRWCPARRPALGRGRALAAYQAAITSRCTRQLDVGQRSKRDWGRGSAAHFWRCPGCFAIARLVDADADGQRCGPNELSLDVLADPERCAFH